MGGGRRRGEVDIGFWWGGLKDRDLLEQLALDERAVLK